MEWESSESEGNNSRDSRRKRSIYIPNETNDAKRRTVLSDQQRNFI